MFLFTSKDTPFISLSAVAVATRLGLSEGKYHDVVVYSGLDVLLTMRAYLILTGKVGD